MDEEYKTKYIRGVSRVNTDKISGAMTLMVIILDIIYMVKWSVSIVLSIVIIMWVLILLPTALVYMRGDGAWKKVR